MSGAQKESIRSWLQLAINVAVMVGLGVSAWSFNQTMELRSDIDAIKSQYVTSKDHLGVWKEIAAVQQQMASLPGNAEMAKIDERQRTILDRLARIEAAVTNRPNGG